MEFFNGQPCWVDIMVSDADKQTAVTRFLTNLFGMRWEIGGPETSFYGMGFIGEDAVMAVGQNEQGTGFPVVYLHTENIEASATAVTEAGGQVFMGPMQVMDAGSMALALDPTGVVFGLWQGNLMKGFGIDNVPGSFNWFDLPTTAPDAAAAFYVQAFGLSYTDMTGGGILQHGEHQLASISTAGQGMPSAWNPIFTSADLAATEARATELGCVVLVSNMPVPGGKISAVQQPALGLVVTCYQYIPE
jgi:predicted enzyme related to lactoylglutathione lyase